MFKFKHKYQTERLIPLLLYVYALALPFSEWFTFRLNNAILIALCVIWAGSLFFSQISKRIFSHPLLLFSGSILFVQLIDLLHGGDMKQVAANLFMKLPFFLFPLVIAPVHIKEETFKNILRLFVAGCLMAMLISFRFLLSPKSADASLTYYAQYEKFFVLHRPYFGMYLLLAICILFYELKKKFNLLSLGLMLAFVAFIFFIQAKMSLLTLGILFIAEVTKINSEKLRKTLIYLISGIFILFSVFLTNYYLQNKELVNQKQGNDRFFILSVNTRVVHYTCALEIIGQHPALGAGCGYLTNLLDECYIKEKTELTKDGMHFNVHNEFLEETARHGLIGLGIYLICFFFFFKNAIKQKNNLYLLFLLIIVFACMTETLFSRAQGVLMVSFFNTLLFLRKEKTRIIQES
jgi:O-antigen ligase